MKIFINEQKQWTYEVAKKVENEFSHLDVNVVIGGDGTLFYHKRHLKGPTILIGNKKSGIAHLTAKEWHKLEEIVKREKVRLLGLDVGTDWAVNDVAFFRAEEGGRKLLVNNTEFFGDGVVITTPLGSTGYNKSAGGPKIDLRMKAIGITGLNLIKPIQPFVTYGSIKIELLDKFHVEVDGKRTKTKTKLKIKPFLTKIEYFLL